MGILKRLIGLSGLMAIVLMAVFALHSPLKAQPSGYCNPTTSVSNPSQYYCYPVYLMQYGYTSFYSGLIMNVTISNADATPLNYSSSKPISTCYTNTGVEAELMAGETYNFSIQVYDETYSYGGYQSCFTTYYTMRFFIDWNMDGDWTDNISASYPPEWINSPPALNFNDNTNWRWNVPNCNFRTLNYTVKIPDNVQLGKTKMRVTASYYYPYAPYYPPDNPCHASYWDTYSTPANYAYDYGETEDYTLSFVLSIKSMFPSDKAPDNVLYAGELYNGTTRMSPDGKIPNYLFKNPMVEFGSKQAVGTKMTYKIIGPLPGRDVIYEALDPGTGSNVLDLSNIGGKMNFSKSVAGLCSPSGSGEFISSKGGEYQVQVGLTLPGKPTKDIAKNFTVSWANDLSAVDVPSPRNAGAPNFFRYPRGNPMKIQGTFSNVGLNNVTKFTAYARMYNSSGTMIKQYTYLYDTTGGKDPILKAREKATLTFDDGFLSENTGQYTIILTNELKNAIDQEPYNDRFSRIDGIPYAFEVADEFQIAADKFLLPTEGYLAVVRRPIIPLVDVLNLGVSDISNAKAKIIFRKLPNGRVDSTLTTILDIPPGMYNRRTVKFDPIVFQESGEYEAVFSVDVVGERKLDDNTQTIKFTVIEGLEGTYTIGSKFLGQPKNFPTIDSAMNTLYYYGMKGSVAMEFTDATYQIASLNFDRPAWDMTSAILGLGYDAINNRTNTLTWRPASDKLSSRGSVTINLVSGNGKGIALGQSTLNSNKYNLLNPAYGVATMKTYANSGGYIKFDGGNEKALKFVLKSGAKHGAAFFLNQGSTNMTIQNCLIEGGTSTLKCLTTLPRASYNPTDKFKFTADTLTTVDGISGYSAGIVSRSILSQNAKDYEELHIDTIPNAGNVMAGNEIKGFGYGIVSLGMGSLEFGGDFVRYYNNNNTISRNTITEVGAAGIFLGFEDKSNIEYNKVYNIGNACSDNVAGIMLGNSTTTDGSGYNNMNLIIRGNEISNVSGNNTSSGIVAEQPQTRYPRANGGITSFPSATDAMNINSNIVWDLKSLKPTTSRAGIVVMTERNNGDLLTPKVNDFLMGNVLVANNTVVIEDDGLSSAGMIAGIAVQQAKAKVMNNAVAIKDLSISSSSPFASAFFYKGVKPAVGSYESDFNVIFTTGSAAAYRFMETDAKSVVLEIGYQNEYKDLTQWQQWTKNDFNTSSNVDFTGDLVKIGTNPALLRVNSNPTPRGSVLENRGVRLTEIDKDVLNSPRGEANRRYDIGAQEFNGTMYVDDAEMISIVEPGAYRAGSPMPFSDAEYIMTTAPVDVKVRMRNNGSLLKTQTPVTVKISCQTPAGDYTQIMTETVKASSLESTESTEISFKLADGIGKEFAPQNYSDLNIDLKANNLPLYTIPSQFASMSSNITPLYKIRIEPVSDENNNNNVIEKTVRFYIMRSQLRMIVSGQSDKTPLSLNASMNEIAIKLNADSVSTGLKRMGWFTDASKGKYDVDYFDRNSWEPRTANYEVYRTLIWTDGHESALPTRYAPLSMSNFLNAGKSGDKKNLVIASQEIARINDTGINKDFVLNDLRAKNKYPSNPMGFTGNYNGKTVTGVSIDKNSKSTIKSTSAVGDDVPRPGLFEINTNGVGSSQIGYIYNQLEAGKNGEDGTAPYPNSERIMSVATNTLSRNVVLLGVDWRHFAKSEDILRGAFDYIENNGGSVVPVELLDFSAEANGKRVDLSWSTASEVNSSKFEIERADVSNAGISSFAKIDEMPAKGKTIDVEHYGPVVDKNVSLGSTYSYRLKMIDKDGTSSYSAERTVTLSIGEGGLVIKGVRPNPVKTTAELGITLNAGMDITAELFDLNGKKAAVVFNGFMTAGTSDLKIDASALSNGVYTLIINAGGKTLTTSINVAK